ncbi:MAG: hypothetical protein IPH20_25655 [Bacteroidales bacterium]|nr:hypothetical protein [Bacteroidales bacterium]
MKIAIIELRSGRILWWKTCQRRFDVTFVARGEHLLSNSAKRTDNKKYSGDFKLDSVKVTDKIDTIGLVDFVILGVKVRQITDISKDLKPLYKNDTIVLPLQNGVFGQLKN